MSHSAVLCFTESLFYKPEVFPSYIVLEQFHFFRLYQVYYTKHPICKRFQQKLCACVRVYVCMCVCVCVCVYVCMCVCVVRTSTECTSHNVVSDLSTNELLIIIYLKQFVMKQKQVQFCSFFVIIVCII